jgi:hypothetical protein
VADVRRQTQSRYSALAVGRDNSRTKWKVQSCEKGARRYTGRLSQRNQPQQAGSSGNIPNSICVIPISNTGRALCWDFSLQIL